MEEALAQDAPEGVSDGDGPDSPILLAQGHQRGCAEHFSHAIREHRYLGCVGEHTQSPDQGGSWSDLSAALLEVDWA